MYPVNGVEAALALDVEFKRRVSDLYIRFKQEPRAGWNQIVSSFVWNFFYILACLDRLKYN
jgi:hypothetical protein